MATDRRFGFVTPFNGLSQCALLACSALLLLLLNLLVGGLLRLVLLFSDQTVSSFSATDLLCVFGLGLCNDICASLFLAIPLCLCIMFWGEAKYSRPWGYVFLSLLALCLIVVAFGDTVVNQYGGVVPEIVAGLLTYKLASFSLRLFLKGYRDTWRKFCFYLVFSISVFAILLNGVCEWFFWNEFGVRYNFIAVDYLIYTTEVFGNIFESYPVWPLLGLLFAVSVLVVLCLSGFTRIVGESSTAADKRLWAWARPHLQKLSLCTPYGIGSWLVGCIGTAALVVVSAIMLNCRVFSSSTSNHYVEELESNGPFRFYKAFVENGLQYGKFYSTLAKAEAEQIASSLRPGKDASLKQPAAPLQKKNIVMITVESLSASFMQRYGGTHLLTPFLDSLSTESLVFDSLYACGNRTVRGLEALSLGIPPCPGHSIIKQPNNQGLGTIGSFLRKNGYTCTFFYGGDSYFDNMGSFFGGNGYDIVDRKNFSPAEISFANVWGVCDQDMYRKVLSVIDSTQACGGTSRPFFAHIMTVSNHRPYTCPEWPNPQRLHKKSRDYAVSYTDYAISYFFAQAKKKEWFANTVFVIVADHCASSAGSTELPLQKYHIPCIVYSPGFVRPNACKKVCSQIDIMPTVVDMLGMDSHSFFGSSVLDSSFVERAFCATYQDLGYLRGGVLTVLSPVRRVKQYDVAWSDGSCSQRERKDTLVPLLNQAIANYQR